ncbi:mucin-19-like [Acanthopagrus latus]|uniref:mucin-19-like n=1 Tax=Acanthopagrus latus TaxID=8177 RepID=UPI00187BF087|nr:mucin-19-like [Acanthopagrus latus]
MSSPPVNGTSRPSRVTTIEAPATTVATPPEPRIKLGFRLQKPFTAELSNQSSPQFQALKGQVASALNTVYSEKFGAAFNRTEIRGFRQGSVVVEAELIFNKVTTLPNASSVTETLRTAASSSNFSLTVNTSSISAAVVLAPTQPSPVNATSPPVNMTSPPVNMTTPSGNMSSPPVNGTSRPSRVTTIEAPATTVATPPEPRIKLGFRLQKPFTAELSNQSSPQFQALKGQVASALNTVYSEKFGAAFNRTEIRGFRQGSVVVEAELIFNKVTTLPNASSVTETLRTAASSSNFSLTVNTSSISAAVVLAPTQPPPVNATSPPVDMTSPLLNVTSPPVNMTSAPVIATSPRINATATPVNATSPPVNMTTPSGNMSSPPVNGTSRPSRVTTIEAPATTVATPPEPRIKLGFRLQKPFTAELSNQSSPQFQALKGQVASALNTVYSEKFGAAFNRTEIRGFRQGSVVVEAELIFNKVTTLPNASSVTETLRTAASSSNFSLTVNTSSISAAVVLAPTQPPPVNATSPPVDMTSPLLNVTSPPVNMTSAPVIATSPRINATATPVNATSPPVNMTTPSGNMSSPPVNGTSRPSRVTTIEAPATTVATPPEPRIKLGFRLQKPFTAELSNQSSPQFQALKGQVASALNTVYSEKFGAAFNRTEIRGFRQGSVVVEAELIFNKVTTLPNASSVTETLRTAASSSNFSLTVNTSSISAAVVLAPTQPPPVNATSPPVDMTSPLLNVTSPPVNMTSAPVIATSPRINATATPVNATSPPVNMTTPSGNMSSPPVNGTSRPSRVTTIEAPATTVATPPEPRIKLGFRLQKPFTAELSNQSSPQFQALKGQVASALNTVYSEKFGAAFNRTEIRGFRQGSVVVEAELIFNKVTTLPNASSVTETLRTAASSSNFSLTVNTSSISAAVVLAPTQPPPVNATSPPVDMTSPLLNVTSPPVNMTSAPVIATSPRINATATPVNATSPPVNMTTPSGNMSSPPVNGTSRPSRVTTIEAPATTVATPPEPRIKLGFRLQKPFTAELSNQSSPQFQALKGQVASALNTVYSEKFGAAFNRTEIRGFRQGSVVVEAELIFNKVTTLPNASSVTETLRTAASSSNFSLTVNTSSISAAVVLAPTQPPPVNATSPPVDMTSPLLNVTSPPVNMTSAPVIATSPRINATATPVNATSPPVNMTTPSGNMSSPPVNGTSRPSRVTTIEAPATTVATPPEPRIKLGFRLQKPFTAELSNQSSPQFQALKGQVASALNTVYSEKFGAAFNRTEIRGFRQGSVVVEAELIFNKVTTLPNASSVTETLRTAASSSNFSLTVNTSSISAAVVLAPTQPPPVNATSPPVDMTSPLLNVTSPPVNMTSAPVIATSPRINATATPVNATSPPVNMTTPSGNMSSPPVNGTSRPSRVTTIEAPATTVATPPEPRIKLGFRLQKPFTAELSNQSSPQFQALKGQVASALNTVYSEKFGAAFNRTEIRGFRQGSVVVEAELIFNKVTTLPNASSVTETLRTAASSSNFSLTVNTSSISAAVVLAPTQPPPVNATSPPVDMTSPLLNVTSPPVNMTSAPVIATSPRINATATPVNATSPPVNMTTPSGNMSSPPVNGTSRPSRVTTIEAPATTVATPPEPRIKLGFRLQKPFTAELSNQSSPQFQALKGQVASALNTVYSEKFGAAFNRTEIRGFRQGSVVVEAELIFNKVTTLPNASSVTETLRTAASSSNFSLTVNTSSISAAVVLAPTQPPPVNATSPPVDMTSPLLNVTSPPVNMTSAPVIATSPRINATATPVNATSPPVNMTTPSGNMSSPPVNGTSRPSRVTTIEAPATTVATPPEPRIKLGFRLQKPFTAELSNQSSPQFQALKGQVASALNTVYSEKFGAAFNRTEIRGFRQGSVVVEAELIFNKVTTLPNASSVTETLRTAASSSNFSLTVNTSSISAAVVLAPTQPPPVNATSPPVDMTSPLLNVTSPPVNMTSAPVIATSPRINATATPVNATSPPVNMTTPSGNTSSPPVNGTSRPPRVTTIEAPATTVATPPEPRIKLGFRLQQPFTAELSNQSSPQFQALKGQVASALNTVYSEKFGAAFNRTEIRGFRQGSVVVEAELIFNEVTTLPNASSVTETLRTAASSSNFSLTVNTSSISAAVVLAPTQPPPVNATSPPVDMTSPLLNVTSPLLNVTSPPVNMTSAPVIATSPRINATATPVNATSPPVNMTTPSGNTSSPPVNGTSRPPRVTTIEAPATTVATPPEPRIKLGFRLQQPFTAELSNQSSPQFQALKGQVASALNTVYSEKFGAAFNRTEIRGFRQGSVVVEAELIFNNVTTLPNASSVTETLRTAASSSNFSLTVNTSSISAAVVLAPTQPPPVSVTSPPVDMTSPPLNVTSPPVNMTSAPVIATSPSINATATPVNVTSPPVNMTTPSGNTSSPPVNGTSRPPRITTIEAPATTVATPPKPRIKLGFRLQQNFTAELSNQSSPQFQALKGQVASALNTVYLEKFGAAFNRTEIRGFRQGSIVVEAELIFNNVTTLPNASSVVETLRTAASSSNFSLTVNTSSISAAVVLAPTQPPPGNATSPPVNMTLAPLNVTSPSVNMTSAPVNATSPPINATAPPVNSTSPPVNMTSPPVNMTTPSGNTSSPPVNGTTRPPRVTTNGAPATTVATPPEPRIKLGFRLQQNFTAELSNQSSPQFQALKGQVSSVLNTVYSEKFGAAFNRTEIRGFRQGSIVVEAELIFNNVTTLPNASSVVETLRTAASSSNFSLTVNTSSISAAVVLAPTQPPPGSATSPPVNMTSPPLNVTSPSVNMTSAPVNATSPPINATAPPVNSTSPPVNMTSPPVNMTTPSGNTSSPPVNGTSRPPRVTTIGAPATTVATPPEPRIKLGFRLQQNFTAELSNQSSPQFQALKGQVASVLNTVYSEKFGAAFNRTEIRGFRQGSIVVEAELIFNNVTTLPNASSVVETLRTAASSSNFSLTVNISSISAAVVLAPTQPPPGNATSPPVNTTSQPVNASSPPLNATSPPVNATSPLVNATSPQVNTTSPPVNATSPAVNVTSAQPVITTGAPASTAVPEDSKITLGFRLQQTFRPQLSNRSSQEFKDLENNVTTQLDGVFSKRFGNRFLRSEITSFSQGSVVVNSQLIFNNASSVPETSVVVDTLVEAATNGSISIPVNTSSVVATRTATTTVAPITAPTTTPTITVTSTAAPGTATSTAAPVTATSTAAPVTATSTAAPVTATSTAAPGTATSTAAPVTATSTAAPVTATSTAAPVTATSTAAPVTATSTAAPVTATSTAAPVTATSTAAPVTATSTAAPVTATSTAAPVTATSTAAPVTATSTAAPVTATSTAAPVTEASTAAPVTATSTAAPVTEASTATPVTAGSTTASPASTDPPSSTEGTLSLVFRLNQTFTSDLADQSSAAFKTLAATVVTEVNTAGNAAFGADYSRCIVNNFTSGSVVVDTTAVFRDKNSVPSATNATSLFSSELSKSTALNVIPGSVSAQSTSTSGSAPWPTVGSLAVLSLTLLVAAQMLMDI